MVSSLGVADTASADHHCNSFVGLTWYLRSLKTLSAPHFPSFLVYSQSGINLEENQQKSLTLVLSACVVPGYGPVGVANCIASRAIGPNLYRFMRPVWI